MKKFGSLLLLLVALCLSLSAVQAYDPFFDGASENCTAVVDLMLAVDGSSSITDEDWQDALSFLYNVVLGFQVSENAAHIGVVQFANAYDTEVVVPLTGEMNVLQTGLSGMKKLDGGTNIAQGIDDSQNQITSAGRSGVPHVIMIITDGKEDDPTDPQNPVVAAGNAKLAGTFIFGIGVGDDVDVGAMQQIVSPPYQNYYFPVSSYQNLSTVLHKIVLSVCHPTTTTASSAATSASSSSASSSVSSGTKSTQTTQSGTGGTQASTGGTRSGQTSGGSRSSTGGGSKSTQSTTGGGGIKCGPYNTCQMGDICCSDGANSNDPFYCCPGAEMCCYGNCCEHGYQCQNNECVFGIFDA
eukprot:TRINITY_DN91_c0_g1_i1.p1 TRINITY_DN91_c0_g1~~TRINITY_DN91_c0_g1_i1.p1  ORF type:complete len:378 (-),score=79.98 TRINITY_DN91_c0_g1_i1:155-1219(-)